MASKTPSHGPQHWKKGCGECGSTNTRKRTMRNVYPAQYKEVDEGDDVEDIAPYFCDNCSTPLWELEER